MNQAAKITTQYLENYGDEEHPHYKYKGGDTIFVPFTSEKLVYEEDAYGPGEHSYYDAPNVSQATIDALVMQYLNAYNGLEFAFSYITGSEIVTENLMNYYIDGAEEWDKPKVLTIDDLKKGIKDTAELKAKHESEQELEELINEEHELEEELVEIELI